MELTGRLTANAELKKLSDGRELVRFGIAMNDYYRPKGSDTGVQLTTYANCAYWISTKVAGWLRKGDLVQLSGWPSVSAWNSPDGEARASLNFHVNNIRLLARANRPTSENGRVRKEAAAIADGDDLPF